MPLYCLCYVPFTSFSIIRSVPAIQWHIYDIAKANLNKLRNKETITNAKLYTTSKFSNHSSQDASGMVIQLSF
jgi:hypothetical protein